MKIAIAGYGMEGRANFDYWNNPENELTVVDERETIEDLPENVSTILGPGAFEKLDDFDLVMRSAGVPPRKIKTNGKAWSATNEFFAKCSAPIIGVTGTKGKGTTCSLITSILRAAGKTVHLVGNIGTPALAELPKIQPSDVVVFEMSSFQLWDLEKSPHIAVVLLIEPDHMNVHESMDDYVAAKAQIVAHQTTDDVVIYNQNNVFACQIAKRSPARKIAYPFLITEFVDSLQLPGKHNEENASAAIAAVREFGVDVAAIRKGLAAFRGLPHRLELVRELDGVAYYNDSFSSAPSATIAAIKSFKNPEIVIIGGTDKGADFSELKAALAAENVKKILLIGEIRHKLAELFIGLNTVMSSAATMSEVVAEARGYVEPGDIVILSPACASFDMFKNFYDRGDQFRSVIQSL